MNKKIYSIALAISLLFTQSSVFINNTPAQAKSIVVKKKRTYKPTQLEKTVVNKKSRIVYRKFLDKSVPYIGANVMHKSNYTGKGAYVVLIDTGANKYHPMLKGKIALEACFTIKKSCPNGTNKQIGSGAAQPVDWHGSHVSGIMAGDYQQYIGVAPDAKIIAINVFDDDLSSSDSSIISALNWVRSIAPDYNIASINMSLGTSKIYQGYCDNVSPPMTTAIHNLYVRNIAVVVAAGNSYSLGMSSPACISRVISVAAVNYNGVIASFSNLAPHTTFAAPGVAIVSAGSGATFTPASGTSMASPHVAGLFAVYRQIYPKHTLSQAVARITASSKTATDIYSDIKIPSINVANILSIEDNPTTTTTSTTLPWINPPTTTVPGPTTTTISKPAYKPSSLKIRIPTSSSAYFYVSYSDSTVNKFEINDYTLACDSSTYYTIPVENGFNNHTYRIDLTPIFASCVMYANLKDGTKSASSTRTYLTIG
jgi:subtilisin family serine protease